MRRCSHIRVYRSWTRRDGVYGIGRTLWRSRRRSSRSASPSARPARLLHSVCERERPDPGVVAIGFLLPPYSSCGSAYFPEQRPTTRRSSPSSRIPFCDRRDRGVSSAGADAHRPVEARGTSTYVQRSRHPASNLTNIDDGFELIQVFGRQRFWCSTPILSFVEFVSGLPLHLPILTPR